MFHCSWSGSVNCSTNYPKLINCYLIKNFGISKNNHTVFGSCYGDVESSWIFQKSNSWTFIGAYTWNNNIVFLSSLITVNWSNLYFFIVIRIFRSDLPILLKIINNICSLTLVRSNNTDLFSLDTGSLQIKHYFINCCCLSSIEIGCSRSR